MLEALPVFFYGCADIRDQLKPLMNWTMWFDDERFDDDILLLVVDLEADGAEAWVRDWLARYPIGPALLGFGTSPAALDLALALRADARLAPDAPTPLIRAEFTALILKGYIRRRWFTRYVAYIQAHTPITAHDDDAEEFELDHFSLLTYAAEYILETDVCMLVDEGAEVFCTDGLARITQRRFIAHLDKVTPDPQLLLTYKWRDRLFGFELLRQRGLRLCMGYSIAPYDGSYGPVLGAALVRHVRPELAQTLAQCSRIKLAWLHGKFEGFIGASEGLFYAFDRRLESASDPQRSLERAMRQIDQRMTSASYTRIESELQHARTPDPAAIWASLFRPGEPPLEVADGSVFPHFHLLQEVLIELFTFCRLFSEKALEASLDSKLVGSCFRIRLSVQITPPHERILDGWLQGYVDDALSAPLLELSLKLQAVGGALKLRPTQDRQGLCFEVILPNEEAAS